MWTILPDYPLMPIPGTLIKEYNQRKSRKNRSCRKLSGPRNLDQDQSRRSNASRPHGFISRFSEARVHVSGANQHLSRKKSEAIKSSLMRSRAISMRINQGESGTIRGSQGQSRCFFYLVKSIVALTPRTILESSQR